MHGLIEPFVNDPVSCWLISSIFASLLAFLSFMPRRQRLLHISLVATTMLWLLFGMMESSARASGANIRVNLLIPGPFIAVVTFVTIIQIGYHAFVPINGQWIHLLRWKKPLIKSAPVILVIWGLFMSFSSIENEMGVLYTKLVRNSVKHPLTPEEQNRLLAIDTVHIKRQLARYRALDTSISHLLANDESLAIRKILAANRSLNQSTYALLADDRNQHVRQVLAGNPSLTANILLILAHHEDPEIRRAVITHPNLPLAILNDMADKDPDPQIRSLAILRRPHHPELEHLSTDVVTNPDFDYRPPLWSRSAE